MPLQLLGETDATERQLLSCLDPERLPASVAIIMDGNGRWAQQRVRNRLFGHSSARTTVRMVVETARALGLSCLTLYAFSTENWKRSQAEVSGLMNLLQVTIRDELPELIKNGIRVRHLGGRDRLPPKVADALCHAEEATALNDGMILSLAIDYGGRRELVLAASALASDLAAGVRASDDVDESVFAEYLQTADLPEPDLLIRTGGEQRISNFLLWSLAYTELYFTDVLWPAFTRADFLRALVAFQGRARRFGQA